MMLDREPKTPSYSDAPLSFTLREGRCEITPQMASEIRLRAKYAGQRTLRPAHVAEWVHQIQHGYWLRDQGISFARFRGKLYLLNGQHRLQAVETTGKTLGFDVTIFDAETEDELRNLYARFDTQQLSRSFTDIGVGEKVISKDFPATYFSKLCHAVLFIENRFRNIAPKKMEAGAKIKELRVRTARDWLREARTYRDFAKGVPGIKSQTFYTPPVMAVALVTLRHTPKEAEAFWFRGIQNDGLKKDDPARALIEAWNRPGVKWTRYDNAVLASLAWNAAFLDMPMQILRLSKKQRDLDIYIEGSPY